MQACAQAEDTDPECSNDNMQEIVEDEAEDNEILIFYVLLRSQTSGANLPNGVQSKHHRRGTPLVTILCDPTDSFSIEETNKGRSIRKVSSPQLA